MLPWLTKLPTGRSAIFFYRAGVLARMFREGWKRLHWEMLSPAQHPARDHALITVLAMNSDETAGAQFLARHPGGAQLRRYGRHRRKRNEEMLRLLLLNERWHRWTALVGIVNVRAYDCLQPRC